MSRPLERLADCDRLLLKINISRRERKQFCFCQVKTKKNILFLQRKSTTKSLTFRDAFQLPVTSCSAMPLLVFHSSVAFLPD